MSCLYAIPLLLISTTPSPQDAAESHERMVRELDKIAKRSAIDNPYVGTGRRDKAREALRKLPRGAPAGQRANALFQLAQAELKLGDEKNAIEHLKQAHRLFPKPTDLPLAMAYLRLGETENCCQRHDPESCLLPIRGGGVHAKPAGSKAAIGHLKACLANVEIESPAYWKAIWLLNLACMTVGNHPDGVPPPYRIAPAAFESDEDFPRFRNIAKPAGLATFSLLGGAVADDFDSDGNIDVMVTSWNPSANMRLFRNDGKGRFTDVTEQSGLVGIRGGNNLVQADYDNDGDLDVFVLRGGWFFAAGKHPNSLLQNQGDGRFRDVTFAAGLAEPMLPSQTAAWADYDNDGDLDLYVGNESTDAVTAPSNLFRNNGNGTFSDVARAAGVLNGRFAKAVVWGDYDGDRLPDLFVSNYRGRNRLYRNRGDGTFTDVAAELGVDQPAESFPAWFWDYDNDGNLDLFVSSYAGGIAEVCASYMGRLAGEKRPRLYKGDGKGGFREVGKAMGLKRPTLPMGCNFGDLDGDGFLDFYLGTGWPDYEELMPSVMYRNRGGRGFADVTTAGGFGNLQKGHAVAFADFDNDGDQDVFEQMGGAYLGDAYYDSLYENPGFSHHWLTVELRGVRSNRSAIGARIRVTITEGEKQRSIYRFVDSGGSFGANPLRQNLGLGRADRIDELEIYWPTSDKRQRFKKVPLDRRLRITEDETSFTVVRR